MSLISEVDQPYIEQRNKEFSLQAKQKPTILTPITYTNNTS